MFKTEDEFIFHNIKQESDELIGNYKIQTNDQLYIEVYTNAGERIIDPDLELNKITTQGNIQKPNPKYLVENDFLIVTDGIYKIQPKLNNFTTWAAYKKKAIIR